MNDLYRSVSNLDQDTIKWQVNSTNDEPQRTNIMAHALENKQTLENYRETLKQFKIRADELALKGQEIKNEGQLMVNAARQMKRYLSLAFGIMPAILGWTIWGFWNWHRRIQVFQDRIMQNEAENYAPKKPKHGHS